MGTAYQTSIETLITTQNPLLCIQEIKPAVDHFDLPIRHVEAGECLSPLRLQGLLLQLADDPVQAGSSGSAHGSAQPAGPAGCQLQLQLQGLLSKIGQLGALRLQVGFHLT